MKYLVILFLLLPEYVFAQKQLSKCVNSAGDVRFTTGGCATSEREILITKDQTLMQFAQKAKSSKATTFQGKDNTDLGYYLQQNYMKANWLENIERTFLEQTQAVVVVDSFSIHKLESICEATNQWMAKYPHPRFALDSMRFEFNTGETFDARYVKVSECDFKLR